MDFLLDFSSWNILNEAILTKHFKLRTSERIEEMKAIRLPSKVVKEASAELGITPEELRKNMIDIIKSEIIKRIGVVEKTEFHSSADIFYPILGGYFKYKNERYPLTIEADSSFGNQKKTYEGNQVYVAIRDDKLLTILLYDQYTTDKGIQDKGTAHFLRTFKGTERDFPNVKVIPQNDRYDYTLTIKNGELTEDKAQTAQVDYTSIQQYNLANGRTIKIYVKFADAFIEGEIEGILNREKSQFKNEGVSVSIKINKDGKELKLKKILATGEIIYLPIGPSDAWIRCKVIEPGYLIDARMDEPINLKFKAIKE